MSDQNLQALQVTRDINSWLARANLSTADFDKMSTHQQAQLGRQWNAYSQDVSRFQSNSGVSEEALPQYSMVSSNAIPRFEGGLREEREQISSEQYMRRRNLETQAALRRHTGR